MKPPISLITSKKYSRASQMGLLTATALFSLSVISTKAGNILWSGATASYNTPADWVGGVVPGINDNAISSNGTNNVVQINSGDPNWTVNSVWAGRNGNGAYIQNGQTLTLNTTGNNGGGYAFNLGLAANDVGVYTLNNGAINYGSGGFNVGLQGTGILNVNGGSINGSGNFGANIGASPVAVTATMDGGETQSGTTWFQQGFDTGDTSVGLPAPGTTISTNISSQIHAYTFASSYTANDAFMVDSNEVTTATITESTPVACSALSFLGSAGDGPMTVAYTIHHADSTTETGSLVLLDWFNSAGAIVFGAGSRANADGSGVNDFGVGKVPYLFAVDVAVTNTASPITTINLSYSAGAGVACIMAVSSSTGSGFNPVAVSGYNQDMIIESGANTLVSGSVVDVVNQTGGAINVTNNGQFFVGNIGNGVYNLSGGTIDVHNYIAFGRSSGNGTVNITGGFLNQDGGGNLLVGTGYGNNGNAAIGTVNQTGGTVTSQGQLLIPESSPSYGYYNLGGTGAVVVNNWLAVGRNGGRGYLNMTNGTIVKNGTSSDHFDVGAGGIGVFNQYGGIVSNTTSDFWLGESAAGTWNFYGGTAILGNLVMGVDSSAAGTLYLKGGIFQVSSITSPTNIILNYVELDAATLQANTNTSTFINNINQMTIGPGATIDSQNYTITIPQELDDNGGGTLNKIGSGTLILTGANTYQGTTTVNAGTLIVGTSSSATAGYTVANNAGFGVVVQSANQQFSPSSLTLGSSGATLNFNLGAFGNPSSAPLNVASLTASGTVTVNISASVLTVGTIPLMQYNALNGSPNYVLGSLPAGVIGSLSLNNNVLQLVVSSIGAPRWNGTVTGVWDLGTNLDWYNLATQTPSAFVNLQPVIFDDNASGTTTVTVSGIVTPASINFTNNSLSYTLIGSGVISGNSGLDVNGAGTVAILNSNTFTGSVAVNSGVLSLTNFTALGASSANPTNLTIGGILRYGGAPGASSRGFTINSTNSTIDTEANLTLSGTVAAVGNSLQGNASQFIKTGPAKLTLAGSSTNLFSVNSPLGAQVIAGTLVLDGSAGGQLNHVQNQLYVGDTTATGASLVLTNTTLNVDSWLALGRINGGINNTSTMSLYNSALTVGNLSIGWDGGLSGNLSSQIITLNGTSKLTNNGAVNLNEGAGSTMTFNLNDSSVFWVQNPTYIASANPSTGTVVVASSSLFRENNGWFDVAAGANSVASMLVKDNATVSISSDFNLTDTGAGANGIVTVQDNANLTANNLYVGKAPNSTATLNINGNATVNSANGLTMSTYFNGTPEVTTSTVNLNGGLLSVNLVQGNTVSSVNYGVFNFNGGRLIFHGPFFGTSQFYTLASANVLAGGAVVDVSTNSIGFTQPLLGAAGDGGLIKLGTGTLYLNAVNTYTNLTTVSAGTLAGSGTIAGSVNVASGASIGAGAVGAIGTLTVNGKLTFAAGSSASIKVASSSNDQISGLTAVSYNGALVVTNTTGSALTVGQVYQLFNSTTAGTGNFTSVTIVPAGSGSATFNPATGQLTIGASAATIMVNPVKISGGNLIVTGTGGTPNSGYTVLTTTNLTTPMASWTTNTTGVLDGSGNFSNAIPVSATTPARFFRVRQP